MSLQFNTNTIDYLQKYLTLQHTLKDFYMDSWFSEDDYDKDEFLSIN